MANFNEALEVEEEAENKEVETEEPTEAVEEEVETEEEPEKKEADQPKEDHQVPLSAMLAERDKAKEIKRELEEVKNQIEQLREVKTQESTPEFDDNPEEYLNQREAKIMQAVSNKFYDMSVAHAKQKFEDYDEKEALFIEYAKKDPTLGDKMAQAADPATFAYETAKALEYQSKYGNDPSQWRKAIEAEVRAELKAESKGRSKDLTKAGAKQPTNINDIRAAGGDSVPDYKPASFDDALFK